MASWRRELRSITPRHSTTKREARCAEDFVTDAAHAHTPDDDVARFPARKMMMPPPWPHATRRATTTRFGRGDAACHTAMSTPLAMMPLPLGWGSGPHGTPNGTDFSAMAPVIDATKFTTIMPRTPRWWLQAGVSWHRDADDANAGPIFPRHYAR